jgi:hypothetical protein
MVTAGLANDVDEVNQYAAPMYPPTAAAETACQVAVHGREERLDCFGGRW